MLSIPITILVAMMEWGLGVYLWWRHKRLSMMSIMFMICAAQAVIITLAWYGEHPWAIFIRPLGASVLPAAMWLAFIQSTTRALNMRDFVHVGGPLMILGLRYLMPQLLDITIPLLFALYGVAMLRYLSNPQRPFAKAYFSTQTQLRQIWQMTAWLLILSVFMDVIIASFFIAGYGVWAIWAVNLFFTLVFGGIVILGFMGSFAVDVFDTAAQDAPAQRAPRDDQIMDILERHMQETTAYLEPELTLNKLARRLHVPINDLSRAVNATTGESISRYINAKRILAAQHHLAQGHSVTDAMLESGFLTKSNFNREFKRITGVTPSQWQATQC